MTVQPEIAAARDDIQRTRTQLSDTISELEARVTAPVKAVKQRLDVGQMVQQHPWTALAVAIGTGAAVAASGADERAATLAVAKTKEGGAAGLRLAREAPSRGKSAIGAAVDALGARLALSLVEKLRGPHVAALSSEPHAGLGFVAHDAPAHGPS